MAGLGRRALVTAGLGVAAAIAWADLAVRVVLPTLALPSWRTPGSWVVGRLAREGTLGFAYDDARFRADAIALGTVGDIWTPNSPVAILPTLPFALLSEAQARWHAANFLRREILKPKGLEERQLRAKGGGAAKSCHPPTLLGGTGQSASTSKTTGYHFDPQAVFPPAGLDAATSSSLSGDS